MAKRCNNRLHQGGLCTFSTNRFLNGAKQPPKTALISTKPQNNGNNSNGSKSSTNRFKPASPKQPTKQASQRVQDIPKDTRVVGSTHNGGQRPILSKGHTAQQQEVIDYAWSISKDKWFIYLLKSENGSINIKTRSYAVGANGYYDYGFCQINKGYHPEIVNDPRFFTDWKWQIDQCIDLYKKGTTFYGLNRIKNPKTQADHKHKANVFAAVQWK